MSRSSRLALAGAAVLVAAALTATTFAPSARADKDADEAAEVKKKRDDYRAKLKVEGKLPFHDLSHYFDSKAAKETRWTQTDPPPFQEVSEDKGGQFFATWAPKEGLPPQITAKILKLVAQEGGSGKGGGKKYSWQFKYAGLDVPVGDKKKMIEGFYLDFIKESTEPLMDKCQEPKKAAASGPADLFATAVATARESKKRERRDWYVWLGSGYTWVAMFEFHDYEAVEKGKLGDKAQEVMKFLKEADPPKK